MKFSRKKKTIFALALSACMAGMTFSALTPTLNASAQEKVSYKVETVECGTEGAKCPNEYKYELKEHSCNSYSALPTPTCEGWDFAGWYTQPVTYYFWGKEAWAENNFMREETIPPEKWKDAIEFTSKAKTTEDESEKYKNLYWTFLTLSSENSKDCKDDCKEIGTKGQEVTKENFSELCSTACEGEKVSTLYARFTPQKVRIDWYVDFEGEVKAWNGSWVYYGRSMGRSFRQYGSPIGSLYSQAEVGPRAQGRTIKGWKAQDHEGLLNEDNNPGWSKTALEKDILKNEKGTDYKTEYQWQVTVEAVFNPKPVVEEKKEEKEEEPQEGQQGELEVEQNSGNNGENQGTEGAPSETEPEISTKEEEVEPEITTPEDSTESEESVGQEPAPQESEAEKDSDAQEENSQPKPEEKHEQSPAVPSTSEEKPEAPAQKEESKQTETDPAPVESETESAPEAPEAPEDSQAEEPENEETEPEQETETETEEAELPEEEPEEEIEDEMIPDELPPMTPEVGNNHFSGDVASAKPQEEESEGGAEDEAEAGDTANGNLSMPESEAPEALSEKADGNGPAASNSAVTATIIGTVVGTVTVCGAAATVVFLKRRRM